MKKISIPEESYWKLAELKAKFQCRTWKELVDLIYEDKISQQSINLRRTKSAAK